MQKVSHNAPKAKAIRKDDATPDTHIQEEMTALDMRIELIQALIPLGLEAVAEELQNEVTRLTGQRYSRKECQNPNRRWAGNKARCISLIRKCPSVCRGCVMSWPMRKSL